MGELLKEKIGVIGVGNMGAAILEGLLKKGIASGKQVWVFDKVTEKAEAFAKKEGAHCADNAEELVKKTQVILLAVKPQDMRETVQSLRDFVGETHCVISILAGMPLRKIKEAFGIDIKLVRAMPNLGAKVGQSITAISSEEEPALKTAEIIFSGCGQTLCLEEKFFDVVTAVSGSGPAYFFYLMEALIQEAQNQGLHAREARMLVVQTALGASQVAALGEESPADLRAKVTSKGGTTQAAIEVMMRCKFETMMSDAVKAAAQRGRELSQD